MRIVEVGPRDGLQNESTPIPTELKLAFIQALIDAGLHEIEVTSFVSPKWVPQLGDAAELWSRLPGAVRNSPSGGLDVVHGQPTTPNAHPPSGGESGLPPLKEGSREDEANGTTGNSGTSLRQGSGIEIRDQPQPPMFSALVPNMRGLERALELGVKRIALFTAVSDAFTAKNINMTVSESLDGFKQVAEAFREKTPDGWIRGYVSTAFECPYAGRMDPADVVKVCKALEKIGVDELSIGDTIGVAVPKEVRALTAMLINSFDPEKIAYHFHDTRGTAIANVEAALEMGITTFDSSAAGLGGCPYAIGAGGNLATEDLVYFLERSCFKTGVDLQKLARASLPILEHLGRKPQAKAQLAVLST